MAKPSNRERVYAAIKSMLQDGEFLPGERIEAGLVASSLQVSVQPVRDALHRLMGETMVESQPHEGFSAPRVTEAGLRSLYNWQLNQLKPALDLLVLLAPHKPSLPFATPVPEQAVETATAQFFDTIVRLSNSADLVRANANASDRLYRARHLEAQLVYDRASELSQLVGLWLELDFSGLSDALASYIVRRLHLAPELVRLLHQRGGNPA